MLRQFAAMGCLLLGVVAAASGGEVELVDDLALRRGARQALLDWLALDDHVPASVLMQQLETRLHHPLVLLPSSADHLRSAAEVYRERRHSVVGLAYLYKCPRCNDWHVSIAGGVMLTADGAGVTNYHVIAQNPHESKEVFGIVTFGGAFFPLIEILAASRADDLAMFRVRGEGFVAAPLSKGDQPGDTVTAITHPAGNFFTVTTGIVARNYLERTSAAPAGRPRISVTADFAKGSSGAGIFNARGELAAIATATRSIYYSREGDIDRNLQMVIKSAIPAAAIHALTCPESPVPSANPQAEEAPPRLCPQETGQ